MERLEVFNPVAKSVQQRHEPAPRSAGLEGKRIGLYWNMKAGGDVALAATEELLGRSHPGVACSHHQGTLGHFVRNLTPAAIEEIASQVDLVIGTSSD